MVALGSLSPPPRPGKRRAPFLLATALAMAGLACPGRGPEKSLPTAAAEVDDALDLAGTWYGEPVHEGRTGHVAIRLQGTRPDDVTVALALPDIDSWWVPVGSAHLERGLLRAGPLTLRYDPQREILSGVLPEALAPRHRIPVELRRVEQLEPPSSRGVRAPLATPLWTFDAGAPIWGGIGLAGSLVLAPSDSGILHALDADSGAERWRLQTGGALRATPTLQAGVVLLPSDDGLLYWIEAASGELRRRSRLGEPRRRAAFGSEGYAYEHYASSTAATARALYIGYGPDMVALDAADGRELWRFSAGGEILSTPVVHDGRVFFGSMDGRVYAVEARTGELAWDHDTGAPVPSSPALHRDRLIIGSRSYDLLALSAAGGEVLWGFYYWFSWVESSAVVGDGVAYIGSSDAQLLHALDADSGSSLWSFDTGGSAWARPAISTEAVYIGTVGVADYLVDHQAGIYAVDRSTGRALWQHRVERPSRAPLWGFASSPALGEGLLYIGGLDGRLYAFKP